MTRDRMARATETLVLDERGTERLPEAIREVCSASGSFLVIEIPGLGRALIVPEESLCDLVSVFRAPEFADAIERAVHDVAEHRGTLRNADVVPGDELMPLQEIDLAASIERAVKDVAAHRGKLRQNGEYPR